MKRRDFLKKSALTLGAVALTGKEVLAQEEHKEHKMPQMVHEPPVKHEMKMHEPMGWADPNIKLSPPPRH